MKTPPVVLAAILALLAGAPLGTATAQEAPQEAPKEAPKDPRIDPETGRYRAIWPKSPRFDYKHMKLEVDFPDLAVATLTGVETLTLAAVGAPRGEVRLDCKGPKVSSVTVGGVETPFELADKELVIRPTQPLAVGQDVVVVIRYDLDYSANKGEGLTYSKAEPEAKSLTRQCPQIHSQGEAQSNSLWFPCHDFPNERLTTELIVTVQEGYEVVANGRLVDSSPAGEGRTRWHWLQDKPHPNYLVAMAIAKFAVIDVGGPESGRPGLSFPVYTPWGTEENAKTNFGNTPKMVALFEKLFDEPYPWDKYAQVMVRDFAAGGMENTSCTFLMLGASRSGPRGAQDDLISHELGHQWFGDLVTCRGWAHLWLNEGWATYCEALWAEHYDEDGKARDAEEGREAYFRQVMGSARGQRQRNRGFLPEQVPIVSNRYTNPDAVFTKTDDPYGKGCVILHMLRERVGDEAFFKGVANYLDRFKYSHAETDDFRRCLEEASGQSLERFFAQWCYRSGLPRLAVDLDWDEGAHKLTVGVEQTQRIDRLNPAFAFALPVYLKFADGTDRWVDVLIDSKSTSATFELGAKPSQVSIDPNITAFAATQTRKPLAMWIDEAEHGVTLPARLAAVEALRASTDPAAELVLQRLASDPRVCDLIRDAAGGVVASK